MAGTDLTEADRGQIEKLLSNPLSFPPEFRKWLADWIGQNLPPIPIDHLQGFVNTRGFGHSITANESKTDATYTELATQGPYLTGLPDGTYVAIFGFDCTMGSGGGAQMNMNLAINGAVPTDETDAAWVVMPNTSTNSAIWVRILRLTAGSGGNEVRSYYRRTNVGGVPSSSTFFNRHLELIRMK